MRRDPYLNCKYSKRRWNAQYKPVRHGLAALVLAICAGSAFAQQWTFNSTSASTAAWPASNVADGNNGSLWTSTSHSGPNATEWIAGSFSSPVQVNYIKLYPRMAGSVSYAFPENFAVYGYVGSSWVLLRQFTGYPQPYRADFIVVPLSAPVAVTAIKVEATKLRADNFGLYYFQLGELAAGYDALYTKLQYQGNNGTANEVEIQNLGSGPFDPAKMKVWNYDRRNPIIPSLPTNCQGTPSWRNVYGASAVYLGPNSWRIFFGGYNGLCTGDPIDEIWYTNTTNNFGSLTEMSSHTKAIARGDTNNVGNVSVVRTPSGAWRMAYTSLRGTTPSSCIGSELTYLGVNKPGYSTSGDGATWSPAQGSSTYMFSMVGNYSEILNGEECTWGTSISGQDVNGTNSLFEENGTWYLYWKGLNRSVQIATSETGGVEFTHRGKLIDGSIDGEFGDQQYGINDAKKINGTYLWAYHYNNDKLWYSTASSPRPPAIARPTKLFESNTTAPMWGADPYIVSAGWVTDGTRLHGVLYGASTTSARNQNAVFARWLQKGVALSNASTTLTWMKANGPDNGVLLMVPGAPLETGTVKIYDADGTTVLYTSPKVTLRQGDVWKYVP